VRQQNGGAHFGYFFPFFWWTFYQPRWINEQRIFRETFPGIVGKMSRNFFGIVIFRQKFAY
jgi:hypothetical protein